MPNISIHDVSRKQTSSGVSDQLIERIIENEKAGYQTLFYWTEGAMLQSLCVIHADGLLKANVAILPLSCIIM